MLPEPPRCRIEKLENRGDLNGQSCELLALDAATGRWRVRVEPRNPFDHAEELLVRAGNLLPSNAPAMRRIMTEDISCASDGKV